MHAKRFSSRPIALAARQGVSVLDERRDMGVEEADKEKWKQPKDAIDVVGQKRKALDRYDRPLEIFKTEESETMAKVRNAKVQLAHRLPSSHLPHS